MLIETAKLAISQRVLTGRGGRIGACGDPEPLTVPLFNLLQNYVAEVEWMTGKRNKIK